MLVFFFFFFGGVALRGTGLYVEGALVPLIPARGSEAKSNLLAFWQHAYI